MAFRPAAQPSGQPGFVAIMAAGSLPRPFGQPLTGAPEIDWAIETRAHFTSLRRRKAPARAIRTPRTAVTLAVLGRRASGVRLGILTFKFNSLFRRTTREAGGNRVSFSMAGARASSFLSQGSNGGSASVVSIGETAFAFPPPRYCLV